jgi:hypothetical protein
MSLDMENDTAAELARLDRVERHLRRLDAFSETAQGDLALARELAWKRAAHDHNVSATLKRLAS